MGTSRATAGSITTDETPADGRWTSRSPSGACRSARHRRAGQSLSRALSRAGPRQRGHRGEGARPRAKRRSQLDARTAREAPQGRLAYVRTPSRRSEICNLCVDAPENVLVVSIDGDDAPSRPNPRPAARQTCPDVLAGYRTNPEPASLGPDGRPCDRTTPGLPCRRHVSPSTIHHIGSEANTRDERETGLLPDRAEILTDHRMRRTSMRSPSQEQESESASISSVLLAPSSRPIQWWEDRARTGRASPDPLLGRARSSSTVDGTGRHSARRFTRRDAPARQRPRGTVAPLLVAPPASSLWSGGCKSSPACVLDCRNSAAIPAICVLGMLDFRSPAHQRTSRRHH